MPYAFPLRSPTQPRRPLPLPTTVALLAAIVALSVASLSLPVAAYGNDRADEWVLEDTIGSDSFMDRIERNFTSFMRLSSRQHPFEVPVVVRVGLLGFDGQVDQRGQFHAAHGLDPDALTRLLSKSLPEAVPYCHESREPLHASYQIQYQVVSIPGPEIVLLEQELKRALTRRIKSASSTTTSATTGSSTSASATVPSSPVDVFIPELSAYYDSLHRKYFPKSENAYTILLVSPERSHIAPNDVDAEHRGRFTYVYRTAAGGTETSLWVAQNNLLVIDLAAGPVQFGRSQVGEGTVTPNRFPILFRADPTVYPTTASTDKLGSRFVAIDSHFGTVTPSSFAYAKHQVTDLIAAAVRRVFVPDIRFANLHYAPRVVLPLFVFRNHRRFNPLESDPNQKSSSTTSGINEAPINVTRIRGAVERVLLPGQSLSLVEGLHAIDEHPQIAMALERAITSSTIHENDVRTGLYRARTRLFVKGALLERELARSADILTGGLLQSGRLSTGFQDSSIPNPLRKSSSSSSKKGNRFNDDYNDGDDDSSNNGDDGDGGEESMASLFMNDDHQSSSSRGVIATSTMRMIPIYVFSLASGDGREELLFDDESPVYHSQSAVIVLQHESTDELPLPYFSQHRQICLHGNHHTTRHIISGVIQALTGLVPPHESFSPIHERIVEDYIWSVGYHPFGAFANETTDQLSTVFIESARRNYILNAVDLSFHHIESSLQSVVQFAIDHLNFRERSSSTSTLALSGGRVSELASIQDWRILFSMNAGSNIFIRIQQALEEFDLQFSRLRRPLQSYDLPEALAQVTIMMRNAQNFRKYVRNDLSRVRDELTCCWISYETSSNWLWSIQHSPLLIGISGAILVAAAWYYFVSQAMGHRVLRQIRSKPSAYNQ